MFIDVMFIQGQPVLTAIDSVFKNRSTVWMADRSFKEFYAAIDHVTRAYNKNGYRFAKMHCDREFKPLMDPVCDGMDIKMFYPPSGDHVPEAERNNRVLQEQIRIQYHRLPFSKMPREIWKGLIASVTMQLNFSLSAMVFPSITVRGS